MQIIDAHIHYVGDHPEALAFLEAQNLKLLNVAVAHDTSGAWRTHAAVYRSLTLCHPDRYAWCTTFDPPDERRSAQAYADEVVAGLESDFAQGAMACKVWKGIGMDVRTASGAFLMVDDPLFDPIWECLTAAGKPLLMHIGEPLACWQSLEDDNPHAGYYRAHPEWYMGDKPEHPSHGALIEARDRVLARHPGLKVVGAHLGSLEHDIDEVGDRLARYPNFAVDTSARTRDLRRQDPAKVREVFLAYPDRILFGTDVVQRQPISELDDEARATHLASLGVRYAGELAYYGGAEGLSLPPDVLELVLGGNARRWYPGL